ncbi:flavoprotein oxygenase [Diaporthe amygdali]|uniref:flavoprotein oxygenase n=1 Tax=Phomopsis amygdali TaxID=1214568 RepID=UPI0022FEB4F3|nr:flavoprotein oxygenase [Diaporthe amygdali]KAJ0117335.1 flavoprotein oxygenase [Diaporthe amygdali]
MAGRMKNTAAPAQNPFLLGSSPEQFKKIEASREPFDPSLRVSVAQTPAPNWKYGDGSSDCSSLKKSHIEVNPNEEGRLMISNYKLLVSAIPRPVSFVSTLSKDGTPNLAPFSYFQIVDHDPVTLVIGFSARPGRPKDTRRNLEETGECVISVLSEHFVEAANATSLDVPYETSEWELSGLTPRDSATVCPKRVQEAVFSIEGKLLEMKSLDYHGHAAKGKPTGALAIIEAKRFWIQEDAINEARDNVDLDALRPVVQLGGISYSRVRDTFELPRPSLRRELQDEEKGLRKFI